MKGKGWKWGGIRRILLNKANTISSASYSSAQLDSFEPFFLSVFWKAAAATAQSFATLVGPGGRCVRERPV